MSRCFHYKKSDALLFSFIGCSAIMRIFIYNDFRANIATANWSATSTTTNSNATSTAAAGGSQLLKKIETILSLSNIVVMSLIHGIKVIGKNLGATDPGLTLRRRLDGTSRLLFNLV